MITHLKYVGNRGADFNSTVKEITVILDLTGKGNLPKPTIYRISSLLGYSQTGYTLSPMGGGAITSLGNVC